MSQEHMSQPEPRQLTDEERAELSMGLAQLIAAHLKSKGFSIYCSEQVTGDYSRTAHMIAADANGSHWYVRIHRDDRVTVRHASIGHLRKVIEFRTPDLPGEVHKAMLEIQRNLRVSNTLGDAGII